MPALGPGKAIIIISHHSEATQTTIFVRSWQKTWPSSFIPPFYSPSSSTFSFLFRLPFHALVSIFEFVFYVRSILSHKKAYFRKWAQSGSWGTNTQVCSINITNGVVLTTTPMERCEQRKTSTTNFFPIHTHFVAVIRRQVCFPTVFRVSCSSAFPLRSVCDKKPRWRRSLA